MRISLLATLVMFASFAHAQSEPKPLFNGKDLTGWDGNPKFWSVKDGLITGQTTTENKTDGNTFLIWRGGTPKDFELRLLWKIEGGNSGVQYRSKDHGNWVAGGYQADIDAKHTYTGILYEERGRGIVAMQGKKVTLPAEGKPQVTGEVSDVKAIKASITPEWNEYIIICKGNRLTQKLNGIVTVEVTDDNEKARMMEGILALQLHAGPPMKVQFKEITLKE